MFKERLKELRTINKYSQEELAKTLSISRTAVSSYELGRNEPPYDILLKIAELLNCDLNYLLGATDRYKSFHSGDTPALDNATEDELLNAFLSRTGIINKGERIVKRQAKIIADFIEVNKRFIL